MIRYLWNGKIRICCYTPNAMVVCASNDLPRTKDKGSACLDRNYYVPFTGQFTGAADDKTISSHWVVSEEFCSYMAYQALVKCENYYELPEPEEATLLKKEFMADNDAVVEFFKNDYVYGIPQSEAFTQAKLAYQSVQDYDAAKPPALAMKKFTDDVWKILGLNI